MFRGTGGALLIALAALTGCGPQASPTQASSRLIVFGDSGSDIGNLKAQSGVIPSDPYYEGRFCNGPIWVDSLAKHLGVDLQPSLLGGTNFAHGAAASGSGLSKLSWYPIGPNLLEQIQLYTDKPDGTELFVVWGGVLDLFHALEGDCAVSPDQVADNVMTGVKTLYDRGGRYFLVGNLPDLGSVPYYRTSFKRAAASDLSASVNAALTERLDELEQLPGVTLYRLDAASLLSESIANPPEGITNVTDPAWTGQFAGYLDAGELSPNSDSFLFWDFVHLSRTWHDVLAKKAIDLVDARPLPSPSSTSQPMAQARPPVALNYWLTFFSLAAQPTNSPSECQY
jgi:outer membrane lipase/esterase